MARSPTGIIPEEYLYGHRLLEVIVFLEGLPIPGDDKEQLLLGWAQTVGAKLNAGQRARVRNSGIERLGIIPTHVTPPPEVKP